ncbi:MAG TPA: hypothetical protein VII34_03740 [Pyrinomonadaceae bacterium]
MKYPITLLVVATVMLLVGVGIRMHADWRYTNKMFYHTVASTLYEFEDVFAERKIGDTVQFWSIVADVAGGFWFVVVKISRDRKRL